MRGEYIPDLQAYTESEYERCVWLRRAFPTLAAYRAHFHNYEPEYRDQCVALGWTKRRVEG